jgi:hypothetical protein
MENTISSIYTKKISLNLIGEFISACLKVGETKVFESLKEVQLFNNKELKKIIIDITCKEFEIEYLNLKDKINYKKGEYRICFSYLVFFIRKYIGITYREIIELLKLENISPSALSYYISSICKIKGETAQEKRYLKMLENIDKNIKYRINEISKNNNHE